MRSLYYSYLTTLAFLLFFLPAKGQINSAKYRLPSFRDPELITSKGGDINTSLNFDKWIDLTLDDIQRIRPGIFGSQQNDIKRVVSSALKQSIINMTELGFSERQALHAFFAGLVELSIKKYDKLGKFSPYTERGLINQIEIMGSIDINTDPDKATILIDDYDGYGVTTSNVWLSEGKHKIILKKDGFLTIEEIIEIEHKKSYKIDKKLRKKL